MRSLLAWSMPLVVLLAAACGESVEVPPGGGGAGGEGGASSTSSSGGGSGGGAPVACGGFSGGTCDATQVCVWADGSCGATDGQGVCEPRPGGCPEDCPGVCGCDGQFYCNACIARAAGVDVSANASCTAGGEYSAQFWPGGLDHIIVLRADPVADRCVMLYLDWPTQSAPGFEITAPDGWGSSHAVVTDRAADCATPLMQPAGQVAQATGGAGTVAWVVAAGMYAPCTLDVSVTLAFEGAPAWAPAMSQLAATGVMVEGGCM